MIKDYQKIRIKLTLLYFGIIFIIVEIFSIIVLTEQNNELKRFEHFNSSPSRSNQSPPPLNIDSETRYELIQKTVSDIKSNTTLSIIILDSLIMLLAGVTSYILSGKTLKPILKTLSQQKQFVSDASHELRTPLTAIKTEAEVILRSKHTELQEYEEFTQSVIEEVDRLSILTSNLLDIAKTDNSNQPFKKDTLNLVDITNEVIHNMTLIAEKSNIKIELKAENNVENILGDSIRIKQLICILIDNAIKYNKENGYVKVNISHSENNIELRVEDNGIGIEEQEKDKVFDRFYRISEDRNIKGFGLGLSIAKQISEEHNAEIKVQSKKDKGTTFIVIFNRLK